MINKVILVGRLIKKPELKSTMSGVNWCSFTLAFDNKTKGTDGKYGSSFINCIAWRQNAKYLCDYWYEKRIVGVEGNLQERKYETRDGRKGSVMELNVESISFFGPSNNNKEAQSQPQVEVDNGYVSDNNTNFEDMMEDESSDLADDNLPFYNN